MKEIQKLLEQRSFEAADPKIRSWLEKEPESAEAHYLRGVSSYLQGKVGESVEALKQALSINPYFTDAAICLSILYGDIGKYDDSKRLFETANQSLSNPKPLSESTIDQKFAVKHLELGDLYFRYKRFEEAIEEYSKAANLEPRSLEIRLKRAKTFSKKGFATRALQELGIIRNENPGYIPARIEIGLIQYQNGNIIDAELEWESVLQLDATNFEAKSLLEMSKTNRV